MISSVSALLIRYMVNPGFSCNELSAERAITPFFPRSQGITALTVPVLTSEQRYASSAEDLGCVLGVRTHCVQGNRITPHRADSSKNIFLFSWSNEGTTLIDTSAYEMSPLVLPERLVGQDRPLVPGSRTRGCHCHTMAFTCHFALDLALSCGSPSEYNSISVFLPTVSLTVLRSDGEGSLEAFR